MHIDNLQAYIKSDRGGPSRSFTITAQFATVFIHRDETEDDNPCKEDIINGRLKWTILELVGFRKRLPLLWNNSAAERPDSSYSTI